MQSKREKPNRFFPFVFVGTRLLQGALFEKIATSRNLGKRNFIVIISEGLGADYAPALASKIQTVTGVETKFARFAHIVRGGTPTLKDRHLATLMGAYAVDALLAGKSNIVICERNCKITESDITYALKLDRMYKGKLAAGDLDEYTAEQIEAMKTACEERRSAMRELYELQNKINL